MCTEYKETSTGYNEISTQYIELAPNRPAYQAIKIETPPTIMVYVHSITIFQSNPIIFMNIRVMAFHRHHI